MAALIRAKDWSATPFGPIDAWSPALRSAVSICLGSRFPMVLYWGATRALIYNDAWAPVPGRKHPWALGRPGIEVWAEIWDIIGPMFDHVMDTGEATWSADQLLPLNRYGYVEECYFYYSYSPVRGEDGTVEGIFTAVTETTDRVLAERRERLLRQVSENTSNVRDARDACAVAVATLAAMPEEAPFAQAWLFDAASGTLALAGQGGDAGAALAPPQAALEGGPWPFAAALRSGAPVPVSGLARGPGGPRPGTPWPEPVDQALVVPILSARRDAPYGFLVAGLSPRRRLNRDYATLFERAAAHIATALVNVEAYAVEKRRAEKLAEIDRAKTVFFSNASHELRTPLTLMLGPLAELLETADDDMRERLRLVERNGQRLLRLVNSLLDFSRIEAGRDDARFVPTDLAALCADLASNFRSACAQAGLGLDVDCPPLPEPVWVDRAMWEKIVLNLLSNAFKFTLAGRIGVAVRARDGAAEVAVTDTGVGIAQDELARVFDRFHRIEGQRGRSVEGTGIGLSLVRELVQLHGGTIAVRSAVDRGTVFTVRIPFGHAHLPDQKVHAAPAAPAPAHAAAWIEEALGWVGQDDAVAHGALAPMAAGASILLADDNADMRAYVTRILADAGYRVRAVGNGAAALAAVRAGPLPDLVLSDVMMPELDGFALLQALRADPATRAVVVILLSARAGEEARVEGLDAGADDYMVKPFSARELRARVDGAIALARQRRAALAREQALQGEIEAERGRAALRESQAHVASLFEQDAAGVAEADMDWRLVRVNDRYCRIVGHARAALLGRSLLDFVHADDAHDMRARLARLDADGAPFTVENRYCRDDGAAAWASTAVAPVRVDAGAAPRSVVAVVLDIGDRKLAERLREADRRKDEFLAMLAHELRNPLAPIGAAAQLLQIGRLDPERLRSTSRIIGRQVEHMTHLIDDLLDVSRVTRGLVELDCARLDVGRIVGDAVEQVAPLVQARRHDLAVLQAPGPALVVGDKKRLVQVLTNLLTNAAKYTDEGGHIVLRTAVHAHEIEIAVADDGIGMAPALVARAFDLFSQGERTSDRAMGGLGLGLALVRSLVELHGGTVCCRSDGPGRGSTFTVRLPRAPSEADDGGADAQDAAAGTGTGPLRVLVVDDNVDAATMLALLLEADGHAVAVEHDPQAALARAAAFAPDACLLDIGLPGMDGNALARRLRAAPGGARLTLVAVTGYGQEQDRRRSAAAGFDHHLVKPLDLGVLQSVLAGVRAG
ncbi:ATP-binding protein [uncultured Massilia sp.]|uniref:ATP-binding protein n=1 Tax=uncultured Massilia sp. TaxID=169973 RepID=UPI0025CE20B9|nr:ATP-binding protein [uncultured Massilia sp.]